MLLLGLALLGAVAIGALALNGKGPGGEGGPKPGAQIKLIGVSSYDPFGDKQEHPEAVEAATDNDISTYWTTERYNDFARTKKGVGLIVDAGKSARLSQITVRSSTPGFTARIDAGSGAGGPFRPISGEQTVGDTGTFRLRDTEARYYVIWITDLDGRARINEVTAR